MKSNFKKLCKDCIEEAINSLKEIEKTDPIEKYVEIFPKFVNGEYYEVLSQKRYNYTDFLIKNENILTKEDSTNFNLLNMFLSIQPSIKKYYQNKFLDNTGKLIANPDLAPYTKDMIIDFIINYLDLMQSLEINSTIFDKIFLRFRKYVSEEINTDYYFCPLHNFKSTIKKETSGDDLIMKKISIEEFREISNLGNGISQQKEVPNNLWDLTHVICTTVKNSTNFYNDSYEVSTTFNKFVRALKLFTIGDIKLGAIYRRHSPDWKTRMPVKVIGIENHFHSNKMNLTMKTYNAFKSFYVYYRSKDLTKSELKFILTSINRFSSAIEKSDKEEKIVDFVISLESLLVSGPGESTVKLSHRVATLMADNDDDREFLWKFTKKAYNFRSGLVHKGEKRPFEIDSMSLTLDQISAKLEEITRESIKRIFNLMNHFKKQEDMIEELDVAIYNRKKYDLLKTKLKGPS